AWERIVDIEKSPKHVVNVAVIGKYIELQDAYKSLYEAIRHGAIANDSKAVIKGIHSESLRPDNINDELAGFDAIVIPGGFGERGIDGKLLACQFGRENQVPTLGICLGMQCMVIEFARNVCDLGEAHSTEFREDSPDPVISLLEEQKGVQDIGGTMRLGANDVVLSPDSLVHRAYQKDTITERHRHRYEFNNSYRETFSSKGLKVTGIYKDKDLVEIIEISGHPWYVGVQFHPEFLSKPVAVHPLFQSLIASAIDKNK
ncbi:MAG: CTP synthase, partial [Spirochaetota bacterium]|nr:CTP synthase [Spirochaetota bacterium]